MTLQHYTKFGKNPLKNERMHSWIDLFPFFYIKGNNSANNGQTQKLFRKDQVHVILQHNTKFKKNVLKN